MPPKPRFTREEIITAAYELMEQNGMDAVVARKVGSRLGSTVAPIFTCFESMEELKAAVHARALAAFADAMRDCTAYFPAFKEFGLRWVRLAREHPHVYAEVFLQKGSAANGSMINDDFWQMLQPIMAEVTATFGVSAADAEQITRDMLIYVHGLASIQISSQSEMPEEALRISLSRIFISFVAGIQAHDGCINEPQLRQMMAHLDMIPRRKTELTTGQPDMTDMQEHTR